MARAVITRSNNRGSGHGQNGASAHTLSHFWASKPMCQSLMLLLHAYVLVRTCLDRHGEKNISVQVWEGDQERREKQARIVAKGPAYVCVQHVPHLSVVDIRELNKAVFT